MLNLQEDKIGELIVEIAYDFFVDCDAVDDFCVQSFGINYVVFGGTNRLVFYPKHGRWIPDKSHCTEKFLQKWEALLEDAK